MKSMELIPDSAITTSFEAGSRMWLVIDRMQNFHYRALVLEVNACQAPRWVSNDGVAKLLRGEIPEELI